MDWLENLDPHYIWLAIGLALGAAEILVPGVFLIWLAGAAIITGLLAWVLPIGLPLQIVIFAALAIAAVFAGRVYLRAHPIIDADPKMNKRGERLAGEVAVVTEAIEAGRGRVKLGDSEWNVRGPDAAVGERVQITGNDGAVLLVDKMD
ncbi:NfeD family protein [Aurantiacibacter gilvus]|uniref:NfeD family protein n=1 Tax=Aurantiacibacter gilvus TaxID=3139141 RepID=A0ABU9I9I6_9SPHN